MSKSFLVFFLLVILLSACSRPFNVTTLPVAPSVTPIANTINASPTVSPTPLIVLPTAVAASPIPGTQSSCAAPVPRVAIGDKVLVRVEDWDKLKLRSTAEVSSSNVLMDLDQYAQLKILDGPICVYSADTGYSYYFWKVVVIPSGEIGWVAEGDYTHYFIEKY